MYIKLVLVSHILKYNTKIQEKIKSTKNEDKELNYPKIWVYGHWNLLILIHIK